MKTRRHLEEVAGRFARAVAAPHDEVRFFYTKNIEDITVCRGEPKNFKGGWPTKHDMPLAVHLCDGEGYRTLVFDIDAKSCDPEIASGKIRLVLGDTSLRPP